MRQRVAAALATGQGLSAPIYMPTGGQGRFGRAESTVMADMLVQAGVGRDQIREEATGRNTMGSALACAALLGRTRAPVFVATSGYHMLRCVMLLRLAGLRARPGRPAVGGASVHWRKRWFWRLREVAAVPVDLVLMLLHRISTKEWRTETGPVA